jgi:hypothetical protein
MYAAVLLKFPLILSALPLENCIHRYCAKILHVFHIVDHGSGKI